MIEKLEGCYNHPRIKEKLNQVIDAVNEMQQRHSIFFENENLKVSLDFAPALGEDEVLYPTNIYTFTERLLKPGDVPSPVEPTREQRLQQLEKVFSELHNLINFNLSPAQRSKTEAVYQQELAKLKELL